MFRAAPRWPRIGAAGRGAICCSVVALLLIPRSIDEVAATIGYEMHVVSFVIGPATYAYGDRLVPGLDYYSQYAVGLPYLFSWIMGNTPDLAILRYVMLMVAAMVFFYCCLCYVLNWLLCSWWWALATTVTILLLQFHTDRAFFDPSSYVLRYPLLVVVVVLSVRWLRNFGHWDAAVLAFALGASLFLNTETGIYQLVACMMAGCAASRLSPAKLLKALSTLVMAVGAFATMCLAAFGPRTLSIGFYQELTYPLHIYGAGFGGWPVDWSFGWSLLYNVIAPGAALVAIAWGATYLHQGRGSETRRARAAGLMIFAAMALLMSAKYSNMSLVALWHVNAIGYVVVLSWWGRQAQLLLADYRVTGQEPHHWFSRAAGSACLLVAVLLLWTANDVRNPTLYAFRAYLNYPSLANIAYRHVGCRMLACAAPRLAQSDVAMIERNVPASTRAAVLGWDDWAYLIAARRASFFDFIPSFATFTHRQVAVASRPPDMLFLPRADSVDYGIKHPELAAILVPQLRHDYEPVERGVNLVAWRRKR